MLPLVGEPLAKRLSFAKCQRLSLWESWREAPERARPLQVTHRHSDSIALTKSLPIAALEAAGLAVLEVKEKRGWECIVCKKA